MNLLQLYTLYFDNVKRVFDGYLTLAVTRAFQTSEPEVTGLGDEGLAAVRGDVVDDTVAEEVEDPLVDRPVAIQGEHDVEGRGRKGLGEREAGWFETRTVGATPSAHRRWR